AQAHLDHHHNDHPDGMDFAQVDLSSSGMPAKPVSMPDAMLLPILFILLILMPVALARVAICMDKKVYLLSPPYLTPPLRAPPATL
ncbi:MAG TPA: hypothetical protein VLN90_04725, partial [Thioalkalivibrio sp.]|nr:hypothetical protein [Thioalkalivibrio sp.]